VKILQKFFVFHMKVDEASGRQGEGETRGISERESRKNVALAALLSVDKLSSSD
jgi:hypothetical protein